VRKRRIFPPSTGHNLVRLVTDRGGHRYSVIRGDEVRRAAINIASPTIAEWAVPQLLAIPAVVRRGWAAKRRRAVR